MNTCKCGCDDAVKDGNIYIHGHHRRGKRNSAEHNRKIGEANKGHVMSQEHKEFLRNLNTGKKISLETREKMSRIAKERGFGKWMIGRKLSKETREKVSKANIGRVVSSETRSKISNANSGSNNGMHGKTHTEDARRVISESAKKMWLDDDIRYKIINHPNRRRGCRLGAFRAYETMLKNGFYNTKPELEMVSILEDIGVEFVGHYPVYDIEHFYHADFFIPNTNTIIEVDGKFWHNYPNRRELDTIRDSELRNAGYNVLRFWEDEFCFDIISDQLDHLSEISDYNTRLIAMEKEAKEE